MHKSILFISLLLALALPVLAVDALGCEAGRDCVVRANAFIDSGQVFNYRTFALNPGVTINVRPQPIGPAGLSRGGEITIFARQLYLSGAMRADGQNDGPRFGLTSGQTGGEVHLFARDIVQLDRSGVISVAGGYGSWLGCEIGNGGSGGHVEIGIVPGAWVSANSTTFIIEGGAGSPVPAGCAGMAPGAKGPNGSVEFISFIPSAARMSIAGDRIRELPVGSESPISVSLVDDFNAPITESVNFASSNATVLSVEQTGPTTATAHILAPGSAFVSITLNRGGVAEGRVYFTGFSRGATDFNIIGSVTRTLVLGGDDTVSVTLLNPLLGGLTPTGSIEWTVDHPEVLQITEQSATRATVYAAGVGVARLVARLQLEDGTFVEKDIVYSVLPAVGRVVITGAEVRIVRAGVDTPVSIEVYDPLGRRVDAASVDWQISNESVVQLVSQTVNGGFVTGAVFRGLTTGSATVTATIGTTSDSVTFNVQPGIFDHIGVLPSDALSPTVTQLEYSEVVPELTTPRVVGYDAMGNVVPVPEPAMRQLRIETTRDSVGSLSINVIPPLPPSQVSFADLDRRPPADGRMDAGTYTYKVTFVSPAGESTGSLNSNQITVINPLVNGRVLLSNIPISTDSLVTSRKIYRAKVVPGEPGDWLFVGIIPDNRATTFVDNVPNAGVGSRIPASVDFVRTRVTAGTTPGPVTLRVTYNDQTFDIFYNVVMPLRSAVALRVAPSSATIEAGSNVSFTVVATDARGNVGPVSGVQWAVSNASGSGVIDQNGRLTAIGTGLVIVKAFIPGTGLQGNAFVTVAQSSANRVVISGPLTLTAGQSVTYAAQVTDRSGNVIPAINGEAAQFVWSATNGQIYQNGTFLATRAGTTVITATLANSPSISASKAVAVSAGEISALKIVEDGAETPAGVVRQLNAVWVDAFGNPVTPATTTATANGISWAITGGSGTASLSGNRFTGRKVGDVAIQATASSGVSANATIYVVPGSAARFTLKPSTAVIRVGDSIRFTISNAFDAYNNPVSNATASWRVSDSSVGLISSSGIFTAENSATGIVTVYAALGSVEQSADVQVLAALRGRSARLSTSNQPITGVASSGIQTEQPVTTVNAAPASGLSGFFTVAGLGEGDSALLLVIGLGALVIALGVYVYSTRDSGL